MTDAADLISGTPESPADRRQAWEGALADAREYLAATVEAVHPDLSARSLLRYVNEYRALCRHRHRALYAEVRIMPVPGWGACWGW
jgi:hypothetical protein